MAAAKKASTKAPKEKKSTDAKTQTFKDFVITKKRSGRFEVKTAKGKQVNGLDKARVLVDAKLVQAGFPKDKADAGSEGASGETPTT